MQEMSGKYYLIQYREFDDHETITIYPPKIPLVSVQQALSTPNFTFANNFETFLNLVQVNVGDETIAILSGGDCDKLRFRISVDNKAYDCVTLKNTDQGVFLLDENDNLIVNKAFSANLVNELMMAISK